jgi:single-strand DNA-binding protein|tara:strand:+ start:303 stop:674 length:372 start_codon:yes stop_codon:yes gene_type:complete
MLNDVTLIGNLGRDPEMRRSAKDLAITKFSLATKYGEETTWHNIVCFGRLGENMEKMLSKGSMVAVKGRISVQSYEKEGQKRQSFEIIAGSVQILSRKDPQAPVVKPAEVKPQFDEALEDIPF